MVNLDCVLLRTALLGLLLACFPAAAEVYTYIDAQGNRVFTDQPHKNAKRVEILPSNSTTGAPPPRTVKSSPAKPQVAPPFRYELLRILVPEPDATVRDADGQVIVTVSSDPALQPGHGYRLYLDGQMVGQEGRSPVLALNNIERGTHQLSVEIVDELGRSLERTPNQPFHMQRISLAQKRLAQPCKPADYGVRPECPLSIKPKEESSILPFL